MSNKFHNVANFRGFPVPRPLDAKPLLNPEEQRAFNASMRRAFLAAADRNEREGDSEGAMHDCRVAGFYT